MNPIVNELGGSLVSLCCLVQLLQLSLENLDMLTLIFDLGGIGLAICLMNVVESELGLHVNLGATPFATRFQNMDTPSLGGFFTMQKIKEYIQVKSSESTYCLY